MKCKPGDLAYITKSRQPDNIGRLVHVLRAYPGKPGRWIVVVVGMPAKALGGTMRKVGGVRDVNLTPIGNPKSGERTTDAVVRPESATVPAGRVRETST